jgi:hypothetical protein
MLARRIVKESFDGVYVNVSYEYIVTWQTDAALSWSGQRLVPTCDNPPLRVLGKTVHVLAGCFKCCVNTRYFLISLFLFNSFALSQCTTFLGEYIRGGRKCQTAYFYNSCILPPIKV